MKIINILIIYCLIFNIESLKKKILINKEKEEKNKYIEIKLNL